MKLRFPSVVVAILFFVWGGLALVDRFTDQELPADYSERALHYLDRCLRLEEVAKNAPEIVKRTIFSSDYEEIVGEARDSLETLAEAELLDDEGVRALAVLRDVDWMEHEDTAGLDETTGAILKNEPVADNQLDELATRLGSEKSRWWDAKLATRALAAHPHPALTAALKDHEAKSLKLFDLELACAIAWWALLFGGLAFIPHAIRVVRRGWTASSSHRPIRYGTRWNPSLVLTLLIGGDLLALGLLYGAYFAAQGFDTGFIFDLVMDSIWRITAPAIALFVLYRKPSHAVRSLGLDRKPDWKLVLATYSVISWAILGFNTLAEPWMGFDPTGGLDPNENGLGGLFYGLLSACILAPIAEEIFYRGVLFRGLARHFGFWVSAGVATLAFVLVHSYDIFGQVTIGIFGFVVLVIYRTTGSLATAIALHALYNLAITLPTWLVYQAKW